MTDLDVDHRQYHHDTAMTDYIGSVHRGPYSEPEISLETVQAAAICLMHV